MNLRNKKFKESLVVIDIKSKNVNGNVKTLISCKRDKKVLINATLDDIEKEVNNYLDLDKYKKRPFVLKYTVKN